MSPVDEAIGVEMDLFRASQVFLMCNLPMLPVVRSARVTLRYITLFQLLMFAASLSITRQRFSKRSSPSASTKWLRLRSSGNR